MASFDVFITHDAEADIEAIYQYIARAEGVEQANSIEDRLMAAILSLEQTHARSKIAAELLDLGLTEFRELQLAPWRIFYCINQQAVSVVAVYDSRRNLVELLQRRMFL